MSSFPAASAEALLGAFAVLGMDPVELRRAAHIEDRPAAPDALLPYGAWDSLWAEAAARSKSSALATAAGFAVPFGSFGVVDYLAGSAATVRGGLRALADHFAAIASGFRLELADDGTELRVVNGAGGSAMSDEFTLAVVVARFRRLAGSGFVVRRVSLTRDAPGDDEHVSLFGAPVLFGAAQAALELAPESLELPLATADPHLHRTLSLLAAQLGLGDGISDIELAVRSRLRDLMRQGHLDAGHVARSLGLSERTLHRRLGESGQRYQQVVDAFRAAEAERLLLKGNHTLAQIALLLGFADQTAWNRAFRRQKGMSPTEWTTRRRRELGAHVPLLGAERRVETSEKVEPRKRDS